MTKEKIKFFIDNEEIIQEEISQRLGEYIGLPDVDVSKETVKDLYDKAYERCSDIFDKYNIDYNAFATILAIDENKNIREQILGKDGANQLLRNIIDIYGDEAYDILGCNYYSFKMSEIDGILLGENNSKYEEFYKRAVIKKCESVISLEQLSDILSATKPEYINQELIEKFIREPNRAYIHFEDIKNFIDVIPDSIEIGPYVKLLVDGVESHRFDKSILEQIPTELFDEEFSKRLLEKFEGYGDEIFKLIPEKIKNKDMWEFAISKNYRMISSLPDKKVDEKMTDEEYADWRENLVVDLLRNDPSIFYALKDSQKTLKVCVEGSRLIQPKGAYDIKNFLEKIPDASRTRQIYEILLEKSKDIIRHIPAVSFEEGISQEEYDIWFENIIINKITQSESINSLYSLIPRARMTERVWNAVFDKFEETNEDKTYFGLSSVPIQNITMEMCERALKDIGHDQIKYIPSIDRKLDTITDATKRNEYEKWIAGFSEKEKEVYREWYENKIIDFILSNKRRGNIYEQT